MYQGEGKSAKKKLFMLDKLIGQNEGHGTGNKTTMKNIILYQLLFINAFKCCRFLFLTQQ